MTGEYLEEVGQRLTEFGGFAAADPGELSGALGFTVAALYLREEPGLLTLVAMVPPEGEGAPVPVCNELALLAEAIAGDRRMEVVAVLLLVTAQPLTQQRYQRWQQLKRHDGRMRLLPWVADLFRRRLFAHTGPPFGTNPELNALLAPEPELGEGGTAEVEEMPRPWVTFGLVGLMVSVWLLMSLVGLVQGKGEWEMLSTWGAADRPWLFLQHETWRLLTANFLHIGALHLGVNSFSLYVVGRAVEYLFGRRRLLFIFLFAGVAGAAASAVLGMPMVMSAGASGAIFGLLGAVIWYRIASPLGDRISWRPLLLTLALNLSIGLALHRIIDNWNHMGGLVGGLLAAVAVGVPPVRGMAPPRLRFASVVHVSAALMMGLAAAAVVAGLVDLPGASQDLAQAIVAHDLGRYDEAEAGFLRALKPQPADPRLHYFLGLTRYHQGNCSAAAESLQRLRELAPQYAGTVQLAEAVAGCSSRIP